jgi:hypothetical protein
VTEEQWLRAGDLQSMTTYLRRDCHARKLRLFACACCRTAWDLLTDRRARWAVEVAERLSDGEEDDEGRRMARYGAQIARGEAPNSRAVRAAIRAAYEATNPDAGIAASYSCGYLAPGGGEGEDVQQNIYRCLLRDIFGNPFRPVTLDPRWQTETVVALATGIYAERAFDRMPILADALEEAGCDNRDVLDHCRGNGPHVRGCWVVDLLLGKE